MGEPMDYKINDLVNILHVSEKTIYKWINEASIPTYQIQHQYRFSKAALQSWIMLHNIPITIDIIRETESLKHPIRFAKVIHEKSCFSLPITITREEVTQKKYPPFYNFHRNGCSIPHPLMPKLTDYSNETVCIGYCNALRLNNTLTINNSIHSVIFIQSPNRTRFMDLLIKLTFACEQPEFANELKKKPRSQDVLALLEIMEQSWRKND